MKIEVQYPVLVFPSYEKMVYVFRKESGLTHTTVTLLKTIKYDGMEIVTSSGMKHTIKDAYKIKYLGFWGFNPMLKGRQILIDFNFYENPSRVDLPELKKRVMECVRANKDFWESAWDIKELVSEIESADSFEMVAELVG